MTGLVVAVRCQGPCGRHVAPHRLTPWGVHVRVCDDCRRNHFEALYLLCQAKPPRACQNCHISLESMKALHPTGEPSFAMHQLDGVYVALCMDCSNKVEQLTRHMYRDTPHGKTIQ